MKKIKRPKFNEIATLAIIVSVTGSSSAAYAVTSSNDKSQNISILDTQHYKNSMDIIGKLDVLVTSGTISQFQKATVIKYLLTYNPPSLDSNISKLSTTGAISTSEEIAISKLFASYKDSISNAVKNSFNSRLITLIDTGTLTNFQKKEIMNLYPISQTTTEELIDISDLVTNKTISKDQEITVLNSFAYCKKSNSSTINDILLSKLDKLILDGTINANQRAAVINLTNMPNANSQRLELHRRLDTLVTIGTITKDNETKIINALL